MSNKTVLIIEDELPMMIVLQDFLRRDGYEVLSARNGADGLVVAKARHPDFILLDILMPKMDGMTMLNELRKDPWGKTARVVILTNFSDDDKRKIALDSGAEFLLKADLSLAQIVDFVKRKLETV